MLLPYLQCDFVEISNGTVLGPDIPQVHAKTKDPGIYQNLDDFR
jgi:hypothetical protein